MSEIPTEESPAWMVVELMGHVKLAGKVCEVEMFGGKMGRIDIPDIEGDGFTTQFFGGQSVYRLTPVTEAVARQVARGNRPAPVNPWDYPKQLPARPQSGMDLFDEAVD